MKILLTIFSFICFTANSQDTAYFKTGDERSITTYAIQQSADTLNWNTIDTIPKGKSSYAYRLPDINSYFRILARGETVTFATRPILRNVQDSVLITNVIITTSTLSWATTYENNIKYFLIQKTRNGSTTQVTQILPKGPGAYSYKYYKTIYKYVYKVTAFYKDGTKSISITFK